MATRCASCRYPLSVSDSVACYECSSYFHIDCAHLVGFPNYELSGDPNKNTFRCATCVLLPLTTRECDSDSGSDNDMPSRQQDYALEAAADIAQDMNDVKAAVQDLSNLCKDMLREINELKSINLTLRCGIENLRHENEERDQAIADLKRRLDLFEGSKGSVDYKTVTSVHSEIVSERSENTQETIYKEHEEIIKSEEKSRVLKESKENAKDWSLRTKRAVEENTDEYLEEVEQGVTQESDVVETAHGWETLQEELESEYNVSEEVVHKSIIDNFDSSNMYSDEEILHGENETEDILHIENEPCKEGDTKCFESEDTLEGEGTFFHKTSNDSKEDEQEEEEDELEEDNLDNSFQEEREHTTITLEDISSETIIKEETYSRESSSQNYLGDTFPGNEEELNEDEIKTMNTNESYDVKTTEPLQFKEEPPLCDSSEEEEDDMMYDNETNSTLEDIRQEDFIEVEVGEIPEEADKEESIVSEQEKDDVKNTESVEDGYRPELDIDNKEEVCEEEDGLHTNEEEILEKQPEGDERIGESHLEVPEEETGVEGEQRLGGQSLEDGEVQPSELPPTPPPQHTEEDLWHYLKEAVTSEHPSTVEEFLHNLIGTLQHVPEEYFQPVIEANIKRVNSPTLSTDGEHVRSLEEPVDKQEAVPVEGAQDSARDPEVAVVEEALPEASPQFTEESTSGDADGYSAVEGAFLAAGFWAVWVMCSLWGT